MFKHILIPTDGSEISQKAIKAGVAFAKSIGARVTGYYALHEPPFLYNRFGDLDNQIKQHVGVYERIAALQPNDSSAFLAAADAAGKDGDTALQISLYQKFLTKYPGDPLSPDIKRQIKALKKQLASGQTSAQTQTTPGTPAPTG